MKLKFKTIEELKASGWNENWKSKSNYLVKKGYVENSYERWHYKKYLRFHGYAIPSWMKDLLGKQIKVLKHSRCSRTGKAFFVVDVKSNDSFLYGAINGRYNFSQDAFTDESVQKYLSDCYMMTTEGYNKQIMTEVKIVSAKSVQIGHLKVRINHLKNTIEWLKQQGVL